MKKIFLAIFLAVAVVLLSGCIQFSGGDSQPTIDIGGVFKSADKAETWQPKSVFMTPGTAAETFTEANVDEIIPDPSDNRAFYLRTSNQGLFYSYNDGEGWLQPDKFKTGSVNTLAIDPKNKCNIYIGVSNRIFKSIDCNRSYEQVWQDTRDVKVRSLAVDSYNPSIVYAGLSTGDLYKSTDSGINWTRIYNFGSSARQIMIDQKDTRIVYVATESKGIFKTLNSGLAEGDEEPWQNLADNYKDLGGGVMEYVLLVDDRSADNSYYYVTNYGIIRTSDGGESWEAVQLLHPPGSVKILSLAISPRNGNDIYYGTPNTLYKSVDRGATWEAKELPTPRQATSLLVHPLNGDILFLGTTKVEEEKKGFF